MTTVAPPPPAGPVAPGTSPTAPPAVRTMAGRPRRRRRWHRAAVPFGVLALLYLITGVAHAVEEPDFDEPGTLSPTGNGPDGSSRLAGMLAARGVTVTRVTSSAEALTAVADADADGPVTVFVPAPDLIRLDNLARIAEEYDDIRLVLVRPGFTLTMATGVGGGQSRWASKTVGPACANDLANSAGPATVLRSRYALPPDAPGYRCYQGGLVGIVDEDIDLVLVGATDPFRNSRIGDAGNAALATGLLSRDRRVVWLDVHARELVPGQKPKLPRWKYQQPDRGADVGGNPLWTAFPPVLWAALLTLFVLGVLVAAVRGRRLGPPVAEPLPVLVPATETITGRGRLYRRGKAREAALEALRVAAVRRLRQAVDPTGAATAQVDDAFVAQIATRSGLPPAAVAAILRPAPPENDRELAEAVERLDGLVHAVVHIPQANAPYRAADHGGVDNRGGTP